MEIELYSPERFMDEACRQAQMAFEEGEVPVGAVVVCHNRVVARAHNQVEKLCDPTAHAEILAITAAAAALGSKYLPDCALYVTLEPCLMCAGAIYWAQLGQLYFGADDPKRGYRLAGGRILHPKTEVHAGLRAAESQELLAEFFRRLR
jgi:tRNA(adenine34) deaminase